MSPIDVKCDQFSNIVWKKSLLQRPSTDPCPVSMHHRYFQIVSRQTVGPQYLLQSIWQNNYLFQFSEKSNNNILGGRTQFDGGCGGGSIFAREGVNWASTILTLSLGKLLLLSEGGSNDLETEFKTFQNVFIPIIYFLCSQILTAKTFLFSLKLRTNNMQYMQYQ